MAYKFQLGKKKLADNASLDLTGTGVDIDLPDASVDADNLSVPDNMLQFSRLEMKLANASFGNAAGADHEGTFKFVVNSKHFKITISSGSGADDDGFATGSGNGSNDAQSFVCTIKRASRTIEQVKNAIKDALGTDGTNGGDKSLNTLSGKTFRVQDGPDAGKVEIIGTELANTSNFSDGSGGVPTESDFGSEAAITATDYASQKSFLVATDRAVANTNVADMKTALSLTKADVGLGNVDNLSESSILANPNLTGNVGVGDAQLAESESSLTISTSQSNGDISLSPHGSGVVKVAADYSSRSGVDANTLMPKEYIDGVAQGLDIKDSVLAASTAASDLEGFTYTADPASGAEPARLQMGAQIDGADNVLGFFDGVQLNISGSRVLIKDASAAVQNGIYELKTVPQITRSTIQFTFAGANGTANATANMVGKLQFKMNSKLYEIDLVNNGSGTGAATDGFAGTGAGAKKTITYNTGLPSNGNFLKFSFAGRKYVINITNAAGADSANNVLQGIASGATGTAEIKLGNHSNNDSLYNKMAAIINEIADINCNQQNGGDNNDAGSIEISSATFEDFVDFDGDSDNESTLGNASASDTSPDFHSFTVGLKNGGSFKNIQTVIDDIVGDSAKGLLDSDKGLAARSGVALNIQKVTSGDAANRVLEIRENTSPIPQSRNFTLQTAAGSDVSVQQAPASVDTRGVLQRAAMQDASGDPLKGSLSDGTEPLTPGSFCFVERGTSNADKGFVMSSDTALPASNAGTSITFTQFSGAGSITLATLGVSSTSTELDLVDGSSAGSIVASKAVIYDAKKRVHLSGLAYDLQNLSGANANATIADSDLTNSGNAFILSTNGDNRTLTLPAASAFVGGEVILLKRKGNDTGSETMTIGTSDGSQIEGENTILLEPGAAVQLIHDGSNFHVM